MSSYLPHGGALIPTEIIPGGRLSVTNPAYLEAQRFGGPGAVRDLKPRIDVSIQHPRDPRWTLVPRGAVDVLGAAGVAIYNEEATAITIQRCLPAGVVFGGKLRPYQTRVLRKAEHETTGVIVAPPGAGKTVTCLAIAHAIGLKPLVFVTTKDLADQWVDAATQFYGQPLHKIGSGKNNGAGPVGTVCIVKTLEKWKPKELADLGLQHGVLFVDECHHVPAKTILSVLWHIGCLRRFGVSATPKRADGLTDLLYWCMGPKIATVYSTDLVEAGVSVKPTVHRINTGFTVPLTYQLRVTKGYARWQKQTFEMGAYALACLAEDTSDRNGVLVVRNLSEDNAKEATEFLQGKGFSVIKQIDAKALADCYKALALDTDRRQLIVDRVKLRLSEGRKVLILGGRIDYCNAIGAALLDAGIDNVILTGKLATGKRKAGLAAFKKGEVSVCIATSLADEGLDVPDIRALIMAWPGKSEARTIQRAGRTMRSVKGLADPVIDDLVDSEIPLFDRQWKERRKAYSQSGCIIHVASLQGRAAQRPAPKLL